MKALLESLSKIGVIALIAIAFLIGLTSTVYLSLRGAEVKVPAIVGKSYYAGAAQLEEAGLNLRRRATRYSAEVKNDTILDQSPRAGELVKVGQTIAVVVSRQDAKEGETASVKKAEKPADEDQPSESEKVEDSSETKAASKNTNGNLSKDRRSKNVNARSTGNKNASNVNSLGNANGNRNANSNASLPLNKMAVNRNVNINRNVNVANVNKRPATPAPTLPSGANTNKRVP